MWKVTEETPNVFYVEKGKQQICFYDAGELAKDVCELMNTFNMDRFKSWKKNQGIHNW